MKKLKHFGKRNSSALTTDGTKRSRSVVVGLCIFLCMVLLCRAQELPPIEVFTPQQYNAGDQNWSITQDRNDFIYIANNKGLLEYNGAKWVLHDSPNESILRSVSAIGDKIYTGGYMDFGCWIRNAHGGLDYTSLVDQKELKPKEDEEFWGIIDLDTYIVFQSLDRIYIYNTVDQTIRIIDSEYRINKVYKAGETIYFQKMNQGLYKIENGKEALVIDDDSIRKKEIINVFNSESGLQILTREHGFYTYTNNTVVKWDNASNDLLSGVSVYNGIQLNNGDFMLGTISNGIVQLTGEGNTMMRVDQSYGLSNNTVLSLKEDSFGNIWLGLDNGINVLNLNSPFKVYKDKLGVLGTVYASAITEDFLYLGTNQGLFYRPLNSNVKFEFVQGTKGQVWRLQLLKGELFCGHDQGTFIIKGTTAKKIANAKGTWAFKSIEDNPDLIIQGNYKGFNILQKVNDEQWELRNKVQGFDISSRYFEFSGPREILVSHEHKGIYKVVLDMAFQEVTQYEKLDMNKGINSSITIRNNTIMYSYREGVYSYDAKNQTFKKDSLFSTMFTVDDYVSGKLINDKDGDKLWAFSNKGLSYIKPGKLSDQPEINVIHIPNTIRKNKSGYENILHTGNDVYLIGTTEGYLTIDLNKLKDHPHKISLNTAAYSSLNYKDQTLNTTEEANLKNKDNNLLITYSVANYNKLSPTLYQYRLKGMYDSWSDWSVQPEAYFENLPFGTYEFEARAKVGGVLSANTLGFTFSIAKPWYLKPLAVVLYILAFLAMLFLLHYLNRRHYKKQQQKLMDKKQRELELEQLENQRQLIQFKNQNLRLDIDNKNRELGMATMNLIKRNELLNNIKEALTVTKSLDEMKHVVQLINKNLNNTDDWKLFEEAFNNADKDFLKKVKTIHPALTPNDLRLCAYLRLNLSSKEIAPLLNISIRSVEVKRYRLRKKMNLPHETSLTSYILDL